jgi:predicted dehydrogenase
MMADGRLDVKPLISHRFPITDAEKAYELVAGSRPSLGILLEYPAEAVKSEVELRVATVSLAGSSVKPVAGAASMALVGSGNYATGVLIPAFREAGARLRVVASSGGVTGLHAGRKFGFEATTTDTEAVYSDPEVHAVIISTRHDTHASMACKALQGGKHVFVEKPLALTQEEVDRIEAIWKGASEGGAAPMVMVGFNRRFSPQVQKVKSLLAGVTGPRSFIYTANAGAIPAEHWTQDREVGGGRIIGEACHFIDLLRFLAACPIVAYDVAVLDSSTRDTVTIQLAFQDGSIGTVHYFANGSKAFPKERLEVFAAGRVLQLDNFRRLRGFGWPGFSKMNLWAQDKGQRACAAAFTQAVQQGGRAPIPIDQVLEVARLSIDIAAQVEGGKA